MACRAAVPHARARYSRHTSAQSSHCHRQFRKSDHWCAVNVRRRFSVDLCASSNGAQCRGRRLCRGDAVGCLELRQHRRGPGDGKDLLSLDRRRRSTRSLRALRSWSPSTHTMAFSP
jgi:hypothetical protein